MVRNLGHWAVGNTHPGENACGIRIGNGPSDRASLNTIAPIMVLPTAAGQDIFFAIGRFQPIGKGATLSVFGPPQAPVGD